MSTRIRYDVTPSDERWELRRSHKTMSTHTTQAEAIEAGRKAAQKKQPSQLIVHGADGRFREEWTYQDDPYPPRG